MNFLTWNWLSPSTAGDIQQYLQFTLQNNVNNYISSYNFFRTRKHAQEFFSARVGLEYYASILWRPLADTWRFYREPQGSYREILAKRGPLQKGLFHPLLIKANVFVNFSQICKDYQFPVLCFLMMLARGMAAVSSSFSKLVLRGLFTISLWLWSK